MASSAPSHGGTLNEARQASTQQADRVALGCALERQAAQVAESVALSILGEIAERDPIQTMIAERVLRDCHWSTKHLGAWLRTGQPPPTVEQRNLAARGRELAQAALSMGDVTKSYLAWRDVALRVLEDETRRLDLDPEALAIARAATRHACDAALVGMVREYDAALQDLQGQLAAEHARMTHLALHDPLTGLANRTLLLDRLEQALNRAKREPAKIALLYLDLNGFKAINDSLGHDAGDRVLIEVGNRLQHLARSYDTVARLGGDEFVILCERIVDGESELTAIADRFREAIAAPLPASLGQHISVSIGTVLAATGFDTNAMLRVADEAMYVAKHARHKPR